MALVVYNPTDWVNQTAPAINETNLNHLERGVEAVTDEALKFETDKVSTVTSEPGTSKVLNMVSLTQQEYDALSPIATTLYVIEV